MSDIAGIITPSILNNFRHKAVTITFISVLLICLVAAVAAFCILLIAPAIEAESPDRSELELYLNVVLYAACLIGVGINMNVFAFQSMTREKARGNIESLLATPLKVSDIWIAKSLAVFLPGLVLGEIFTLITLIAVNYIYFVPQIGFLFTPWMFINGFVVVPVIYLSLSLF